MLKKVSQPDHEADVEFPIRELPWIVIKGSMYIQNSSICRKLLAVWMGSGHELLGAKQDEF